MSDLKKWKISKIDISKAKQFVCENHYSKSLPGCFVYFGFFDQEHLVGVAAFGSPAMKNQASCYDCDIELRRFCLIDETPKNAESRFLSLALKELRKMGFKSVLSLADPEHGHYGIIYRASNFEFLGEEKGGGSRLIIIDEKEIHSRSAFAKYGTSGINSLKKLLGEDRVSGRNKKRKYVYRFKLNC